MSWGQGVGAASSRGGPGVWGKDEVRWGAGRESEADEGLACGGGAAGLSSGVWGGGCKPEVRFGVWGGGSEAGGRVLGGEQSNLGASKAAEAASARRPHLPPSPCGACMHAQASGVQAGAWGGRKRSLRRRKRGWVAGLVLYVRAGLSIGGWSEAFAEMAQQLGCEGGGRYSPWEGCRTSSRAAR